MHNYNYDLPILPILYISKTVIARTPCNNMQYYVRYLSVVNNMQYVLTFKKWLQTYLNLFLKKYKNIQSEGFFGFTKC